MNSSHPKCAGENCGCRPVTQKPVSDDSDGLARRDFLRLLGLGGIAMATLPPWESAMAGPFSRADFEKLVPADKKLSPEWVKSLTARGGRTMYRGAALANIGMPIGGLCAGQVYLGGDGRLWHWDIFNQHVRTGADHYAKPVTASSPLDQGFVLRLDSGGQVQERKLDSAGWKEVTFIGEYPIGYVTYADADCAVNVSLEAFSPFVPLNTDDSSLPATVLEFTLKNTGGTPVEGALAGWLENAVCLHSAQRHRGSRNNRVVRDRHLLLLECSAEDSSARPSNRRPNITFDDFEGETYGDWTTTGTAFGHGPVETAKMPSYQGEIAAHGRRLVNTHASAAGTQPGIRDSATGRLTSRTFKLERDYITFLIGGGDHKDRTCMNLLVDGAIVRSTTGASSNKLQPIYWDVREWAGKSAQLVIVDEESGGWGNIGVDNIVFSDQPRQPVDPLAAEPDFGTLGLALLEPGSDDYATPDGVFPRKDNQTKAAKKPFGEKLAGSLARSFKLSPGKSVKITFLITWHFPNLKLSRLPEGRYYASRFASAKAVAVFAANNFRRLAEQTRLWHETWYDSTLPYWFLDRTFLNTSILATSTCQRLGNGRFYAWEGVGCCEGTCGHVWHYAHAMARIFPELERSTRENVDFGLALQPDGAIHFRGELNNSPAIDAQAGTILRALREHQMSRDNAFLKTNWPRIRRAVEWLVQQDANRDGIIESNQHNTLDRDWFGPVAWLSGLYLAALRAAEAMAKETGDLEFAARCREIFNTGEKNLVARLFDGEYFINQVSAQHLDAINSGTGCEIDQVMGQSWAFQVGLPRVLPEAETRAALRSLWRYNFTPDVGPYREAYPAGRWYAMPGEAGLLMCSFPRTGWDYAQAAGKGPEWAAGYFNECMNGFEYQVAGHLLWEGMITEGLAVTRAVHDRYHGSRRNPWNEIECGDHYARSMASYGVYLAACGFECHGPKGHIGFAPRLTPENFKCAFTSAEGWGSFSQKSERGELKAEIALRWGKLLLKTMSFAVVDRSSFSTVMVRLDRKPVPAELTIADKRALVTFVDEIHLTTENDFQITLL